MPFEHAIRPCHLAMHMLSPVRVPPCGRALDTRAFILSKVAALSSLSDGLLGIKQLALHKAPGRAQGTRGSLAIQSKLTSPGFGLIFLSSDSDRFRSCQVRIRIGFAGPGSDSDRFRRARFGFGSISQGQVRIRIGFAVPGPDSLGQVRIRIGFGKACGFDNLRVIIIASGGHAFINNNNKLNASPGGMASAAG